MSIFKVGDKGRVIYTEPYLKLLMGEIATIVAVGEFNGPGGKFPYEVEIRGKIYCSSGDDLEPILPSPALSEMTYAELMLSFSDEVTA